MNNTDISDALSGIDSSFIDEAAYELHGNTEPVKEKKDDTSVKSARTRRTAKILYITIPAAAAIILMVCVALPAILRVNKSTATAESANYAPAAADAAAEAPMEESAAEAEEEPVAQAEEAEIESKDEVMEHQYINEDEEPIASAAASEPEAYADTAGAASETAAEYEAAPAAEESAESYDEEADRKTFAANGTVSLLLGKAVYENGTLLIDAKGTIPENIEDIRYSIASKDGDKEDMQKTEGRVGDILKKEKEDTVPSDKLKFDISSLKLSPGSYTITVGSSSTDFTVR